MSSLQNQHSLTYNHGAVETEDCCHGPSVIPVAQVSQCRGGWSCGLGSILTCRGEDGCDLGLVRLPHGFSSSFPNETQSTWGWGHPTRVSDSSSFTEQLSDLGHRTVTFARWGFSSRICLLLDQSLDYACGSGCLAVLFTLRR